ncbi:hypothetical protein ANRL4_04204 [Anaerolineae bacterium]|nr:hypothetical protein ANRL4_04204 [Anaerolineae bacterium]
MNIIVLDPLGVLVGILIGVGGRSPSSIVSIQREPLFYNPLPTVVFMVGAVIALAQCPGEALDQRKGG